MANMEATNETNTQQHIPTSKKYTLLIICCIILAIGNSGGPLIMRLYFIHHGERIWLSSWLQSAGWPLILLLLIPIYFRRRATAPTTFFLMKPRLFVASAVIGTLTGLDSYLYAYGVSRLPVSTSSLLLASQLTFTAAFAFLLVKQKFTSYSINAVVLLTVGAGILALHTSSDRPEGVTKKEYVLGFLLTLIAAVLYGFILPLVELTYRKAKQVITYTLVLEIQIVICIFATLFSTVGMLVNKDFQAIPREARHFGIGEARYYIVLVCSGIIWQFYFLGAIGIIFCSSSLLSGVVVAFLLPVTEILAVICYQEKFQAEKGVSLLLSLWGFVSYFYGEFKHSNKIRQFEAEMDLPRNHQMIAA